VIWYVTTGNVISTMVTVMKHKTCNIMILMVKKEKIALALDVPLVGLEIQSVIWYVTTGNVISIMGIVPNGMMKAMICHMLIDLIKIIN